MVAGPGVRAATLIAVVSALLLVSLPAWGQDNRSYRIGDVRIDARLRPDGSLRVTEQREFLYDGTSRGAFYELPLRDGQEVREFTLTDSDGTTYRPGTCDQDGEQQPGTYHISQDGRFTVTWCYATPATDTSRTYTLDYLVTGAGTRHADASQLYWQWVGEGWDVPTGQVIADVRLPASGDDLELWAHGPLGGTVRQVQPGVVRTRVPDLPPNTFVELRVLMPADALARAPSDGEAVRADILAYEECLRTAADADRARAQGETPAQDCDPDAGRGQLAAILLAVAALAGVAGWVWLFLRRGREHPLPQGLADYERELPTEDAPAVVDWLMHWGDTTDQALVATIMDLARRGQIRIRHGSRDRDRLLLPDTTEEVTVFEYAGPPEHPWERMVHELLFTHAGGGARAVSDQQLKDWVSEHRKDAYDWWRRFTRQVRAEVSARGWIEPRWPVAVSALIGFGVIVAAVVAAVAGATLFAVIPAGVTGAALVVLTPFMRRRSPVGRVLHHRWERFGAYLEEYSLIPERGAEYLSLWGAYLVYAVPLGVADTVMRNLDANLSDVDLERAAGGWYPLGAHDGRPASFSDGLSSLTAAVPASTISSSRSSSGSGGGFSGGGGGGGGGSGGGAF